MGPPRTRRPLSASRFHEGSMNDRASAAPPVSFLGPAERARLEKPLRPMSDDWAEKQVRKNRLLGQVWDGVRGRLGLGLGLRREQAGEEKRAKRDSKTEGEEHVMASYEQLVATGFFPGTTTTTTAAAPATRQPGTLTSGVAPPMLQMPTPKTSCAQLRPTKEEVMENYHHLVASGFFSAHAIQSTRVPGPAGRASSRPTSSTDDTTMKPPAAKPARTRSRSPAPPPDSLHPQWPLPPSRSATPSHARAPSPARPLTRSSSRGTKRAAVDMPSDDEDEDPPTPKKKLRQAPSREISMPKLRSVASRRNILGRRSASGPKEATMTMTTTTTTTTTNGLAKRVLGRLPGGSASSSSRSSSSSSNHTSSSSSSRRRSLDGPTARRCASGPAAEERRHRLQEANTRVLRPRKSANEGLSIVPDVNRGIPSVPAIPAKFAVAEDQENHGPRRDRLRR